MTYDIERSVAFTVLLNTDPAFCRLCISDG